MKTLTEKTKKQADQIININSINDIPLSGLAFNIAKTELRFNGFYSYTKSETNEKILLINN